jgi:hypothetical protein
LYKSLNIGVNFHNTNQATEFDLKVLRHDQ